MLVRFKCDYVHSSVEEKSLSLHALVEDRLLDALRWGNYICRSLFAS